MVTNKKKIWIDWYHESGYMGDSFQEPGGNAVSYNVYFGENFDSGFPTLSVAIGLEYDSL